MPPASEELRKSKQFKYAVEQIETAIELERDESQGCQAAHYMDGKLTDASEALSLGQLGMVTTHLMMAMSTASGANRHLDAGKKAGKAKK